ncbi:prealbumin-like fold domain-containing protein [Anaerococcus vaginalis]|uniref:MSCRAMM family protein n=1 Tax=Anaerococcus vaginalis TaxID=33037 RepID=UPI00290379F8|nr:prealbumin-like fold domain-containing protein [Anaerococcus vaginalis]MDU2374556.1 prealbumin-like fold domain-containing protein [Anaerococcus vaginalis]
MKKFNKNLISVVVLAILLQLVTPLLAFAKSGNNSLIINTNYTDKDLGKEIVIDYVDYWKIPDEKTEDLKDPQSQLDFVNLYKEKTNEEISKDLGELKSSNKSEENKNNGMYFARIEGLEKGVYLLRYRSNDQSKLYIPFLAIIDENTENHLTIYPKKAPDSLMLTKRDGDDPDKKVLPGVGFIVVNEKGETLKFNKIDEKSEKAEFAYDKDGKISEIFTDQKGQIKLYGLTEKVKFKESTPLKGYEKNKGLESGIDKDRGGKDYLENGDSIDFLNKKDNPENYFSFQKIDGINNDPLKGAIFKVQEKTKDGYKDLKENEKIYTLTSGENGEFKTKNLPYGDYRLIETKAPQGYVQELDAVDFTIGETSSNKTIKVKNYKPTTPGPKGGNNRLSKRVDAMAKTGDATIYLILLLGLLMIGVGVKFVRAKE